MQFTTIVAAVAALAAGTEAATCRNLTLPVSVSARTGIFNLAVPMSNLDVTTLQLNITQQGRNFTQTVLTGYNTTTGNYNISGTFCMPDNMTSTATPNLQILTHGIGFDKGLVAFNSLPMTRKSNLYCRYWNIPFNGYNYSYVNTATAAGQYFEYITHVY